MSCNIMANAATATVKYKYIFVYNSTVYRITIMDTGKQNSVGLFNH